MDEQNKNTYIIFTTKAINSLEKLIKNFGLEENVENFIKNNQKGKSSRIVIVGKIIKDFALGKILEKELTSALEKGLGVSAEIGEKIKIEITNNIVPFLEKIPEEKLKDPFTVDELAKKFWPPEEERLETIIKKPQILTVEENEKIIKEQREKKPILTKKLDDFPVIGEKEKLPEKKLPATEKNTKSTAKIASSSTAAVGAPRNDDNNEAETKSKLPKKPIIPPTQRPKSSGPDSYRESIE